MNCPNNGVLTGTVEEINAYKNDVNKKLKSYFGEESWDSKIEEEKNYYENFILDKYLRFLDGKQDKEEKASSRQNKDPEIDYYKLPRLDEAIKKTLKDKFEATDSGLRKLYHPSDIDIYPKSQTGRLEDPNPPSRGWKNPMAMRTMYELRKLINYLLDIGKVDDDTKIVVEMARELNDANKRWAIQAYQKQREEENIEFAKAILGVAKKKYPNLNENDADNIDKVRLWWEQLGNSEEVYKQIKSLKEDVQKYRLWKEQECQCMYTGKMFGIVDLFDSTKTQFEHTLYLSKSFDNSLANLTVCDAQYNMSIKKNQIPTELKNYKEEYGGYPAIEPKLQKWKEKVQLLKDKIEENKIKTKKAIRNSDIETKNKLIKDRHLLQFDLDYWYKKLQTFTVKEIPDWWKNSQMIDTQIISKYARAYLKTVFNKVDVQKGTITAEFRKIYQIMGDEKKDRSKHSHHAIDAAVLTLIPGSAKRDAILEKYYAAIERKAKYHTFPYADFSISHVLEIENNVIINHVTKDQTLNPAIKKVRKRGKVEFKKNKTTKEFLKDKAGNKMPKIMQGDSVRGQLHNETYFGAIRVPERNENGFAIKENGKYIVKKDEDQNDTIWIVVRKLIGDLNIESDNIIDVLLKKHIQQQLNAGHKIEDVVDFQGKKIRHIRCRVAAGRGFLSKEKAIELRQHTYLSKSKHKQYVLAQNSNEGNYLYLFYEKPGLKKPIRDAKIITLFDFHNYGYSKVDDIWENNAFSMSEKNSIPLKHILKTGQKAIFYSESSLEISEIPRTELNNRIFKIYKFNEMGTPNIFLQNHIEARPDKDLDDGDTEFDKNKYQYRLKLKANKLNCIFEGIHFNMQPDGEIQWLKDYTE